MRRRGPNRSCGGGSSKLHARRTNANGGTDSKAKSGTHGYTYRDDQGRASGHGDTDSDCRRHCNADARAHSHSDSATDSNGDADSVGNLNSDSPGFTSTDSNRNPGTSAKRRRPTRGIGNLLRRG